LSLASRSIICRSRRQRQVIDMEPLANSRYFPIINFSVVTSRVIDSDPSHYFQRLDSSSIRKMTRLESTAPNDSTRTRLVDFAVNDSSQLSYNLYRINSSKLLWLGRTMSPVNNENFETLSENIWDLHWIYSWRACLYYISVFRNNASSTVFKMEYQNVLYLY
jgi:hypothetical protein